MRRPSSAPKLGPEAAARLYARLSGCLFLLLAFFGAFFFVGLAWYGIDSGGFIWPWIGVGILGVVLLVARGLRVVLVVAALAGIASTAFWLWAWTTSSGLDGEIGLLVAMSILAALTALGGWLVERRRNQD